MRWLLSGFLTLLLAIACWIALFAFGIRPDYSKWSNFKLMTVHFLPPVGLCLAWWLGRWYLGLRKGDTEEAQQGQAQTAAQVLPNAEQARSDQRRRYCHCLLLAISDLAVHEALELPEGRNVSIGMVKANEKSQDLASEGMPSALSSGIAEALAYIYAECGAAAAMPVYLVPPTDFGAGDVAEHVRKIAAKLIFDMKLKTDAPPVMAMQPGAGASNSVLGLFDATPDLAAAVVLAFDSPMAQPSHASAKPGHGVFAMLLTAADLPAMLASIAKDEAKASSLTSGRPRELSGLARISKPLRDELGALVPVARIHRAASGTIDEQPGRTQALEQGLAALLEQAQSHMEVPAADFHCNWLVHNAGESPQTGGRLAAIAGALMQRKIELKPVEMATDMVRHLGDLGRASSFGMLAVALAQAQGKQAPVLCAEFAKPDSVFLAYAAPQQNT